MQPQLGRRFPLSRLLTAGSILAAFLITFPAGSEGGEYTMTRWTVDGGGAFPLEVGRYRLGGTIGQPDAGPLASGSYAVGGGFWGSFAPSVVGVADTTDADPGAPPGGPPAETLQLRVLAPAPNPVLYHTRIAFDLPDDCDVDIRVYDLHGALVRTLADDSRPAGRLAVEWDARDLSGERVGAGIYFVRVRLGTLVQSHKLVVVR